MSPATTRPGRHARAAAARTGRGSPAASRAAVRWPSPRPARPRAQAATVDHHRAPGGARRARPGAGPRAAGRSTRCSSGTAASSGWRCATAPSPACWSRPCCGASARSTQVVLPLLRYRPKSASVTNMLRLGARPAPVPQHAGPRRGRRDGAAGRSGAHAARGADAERRPAQGGGARAEAAGGPGRRAAEHAATGCGESWAAAYGEEHGPRRSPRRTRSSRRSTSRSSATPSAGPTELGAEHPADRHAAPAQPAARSRPCRATRRAPGGCRTPPRPARPADGRGQGPARARHVRRTRRQDRPALRHAAPRSRRSSARRGAPSSWPATRPPRRSRPRSSSPTPTSGSRTSRSTPSCSTRPAPPPAPSAATPTFPGPRRRPTWPGWRRRRPSCCAPPLRMLAAGRHAGLRRLLAAAGGGAAARSRRRSRPGVALRARADPPRRAARPAGRADPAGEVRTLPGHLAASGGLDGFFVAGSDADCLTACQADERHR